jgi:hypothetical protein
MQGPHIPIEAQIIALREVRGRDDAGLAELNASVVALSGAIESLIASVKSASEKGLLRRDVALLHELFSWATNAYLRIYRLDFDAPPASEQPDDAPETAEDLSHNHSDLLRLIADLRRHLQLDLTLKLWP